MRLPRLLLALIDPASAAMDSRNWSRRRPLYRGGAVFGSGVPGGSRQATPEEIEKAIGELQKTAPYVVDGQYVVIPGQSGEDAQIQVTAKLVEVKGAKVVRSSARNGSLLLLWKMRPVSSCVMPHWPRETVDSDSNLPSPR